MSRQREEEQIIEPIAAFIGARLQYPCPEINGQGNPWVSTISVTQSKEKFWHVRVYCELAYPELVKQKWQWLKQREAKRLAGEQTYSRITQGTIDMLVASEPTPEFTMRCLRHDAIHYRRVYLEMVELRPALRDKICSQADYGDLLKEDLNAVLNAVAQRPPEGRLGLDDASYRDFLRSVYDPTSRDLRDLRD